jgi:methylated-DNA-[protein]-cysteine S-methyltransferase
MNMNTRSAVRNERLSWTVCKSPIGPLTLIAGPRGLTNIHFSGQVPRLAEAARRPMPEAVGQLEAYFAAERRAFELDLDLRGAPLQTAVWQQLLEIPHGTTTTYGEIAGRIDEALYEPDLEPYKRARVVGAAIGRNPVPVVVACHRVIGADGSLTGYFGGLQRKRTLLELEGWEGAGPAAERSRSSDQMGLL